MSTDLAKLVVRLEAEIGKYSENLDKAERKLSKFADSSEKRFQKLAGGVAAFFTVDRLKAWGDHILENADSLGKLSERSGISTESLSKLQYAFKTNNVEAESFVAILKGLNGSLAESQDAKSEAAAAFRALGIETKTATGEIRKADDVLLDIADRFASYEDGANKSALATALLKKQGEAAIPALNGGAEGLKRLGDEAVRVGAVISDDLAKAADEFNDRADRLKTTLIDGVGNRIASQLLPNLNKLGEALEGDGQKLQLLDTLASAGVFALQVLTDVVLGAGTSFAKLGNAIGATAAAAVQASQFNFKEAGEIWRQATEDNLALEAQYQKARKAIWEKGGADVLQEVEVTAKKIKDEAPNLAGGKALGEATQKAIDKLRDMQRTLEEQVSAFGLGDAAALKYRLTIGNLKDEVTAAGAAGEGLADSIIKQAEALEHLKNAKEIADALADVNAQILDLQGNSAEAAIAQLDAKNAELVKKLRAEGDTAGLKQLDTLTKLVVAQADFNDLAQKAERIQADLDRAEQRLSNSRETGAITDIDYQHQLSALRQQAVLDLQAINAEQQKIADTTGNPEQIENVKRLGAAIDDLAAQSELAGAAIRKGFESSFADALKTTIKNIHDADDAFKAFIDSVIDQLLELAVQQTTQQIFQGIFGGTSSSAGGFFNVLGSIFGGGAATGRDVTEGMAYRVNENTPNSEWFIPDTSGRVVPADKLGGMSVNQKFVIQAPRGTVTRQTQLQVAATAATGIARASRRNN